MIEVITDSFTAKNNKVWIEPKAIEYYYENSDGNMVIGIGGKEIVTTFTLEDYLDAMDNSFDAIVCRAAQKLKLKCYEE